MEFSVLRIQIFDVNRQTIDVTSREPVA